MVFIIMQQGGNPYILEDTYYTDREVVEKKVAELNDVSDLINDDHFFYIELKKGD